MNFVRSFLNIDKVALSLVSISATCILGEATTRTNLSDAQNPKDCRYPPLSNVITEAHVRELEEKSVVIIHDVLSAPRLQGARDNVKELGKVMNASNHQNDCDIRQDQILSIRENDALDHGDDLIHCIKLLRGIPFILERFEYATSRSHIVPRQCQLARYLPDGSAYVRHVDRCNYTLSEMGLLGWLRSSDYRQRTVTAILYLNAARWKSGGELRLFDRDDETHKDVIPNGGKLIIFDSANVEHQVLASQEDRYALTCWFNGDRAE